MSAMVRLSRLKSRLIPPARLNNFGAVPRRGYDITSTCPLFVRAAHSAAAAATAAVPIAPSAAAALGPAHADAPARDEQGVKCLSERRSLSKLYWKLSKGKLTVWVSLSAMPGYLLALPGAIDPMVMAALASGTFLTSASAQTMNQIIEIERDAKMYRTAQRPLPSGMMSVQEASRFSMATGAIGLGILTAGATPATAAIAGTTILTYAGIYTPLKVLTPYNTHVGAISGALPTVLGFTAALGTGLVTSPWMAHAAWLFTMQVLWQMPHFYALAWIHRADYLRGGYNMFPLSDSTGLATAAMSKPYLVALCAMPCAASALGLASWMLPVGAAVPSFLWWRSLRRFEDKPNPLSCRRFFLGSLAYLLATLGLFTAYARVETEKEGDEAQHSLGDRARHAYLEPEWRAALAARLTEFCPHEQVRSDLFGLLGGSCPFSSARHEPGGERAPPAGGSTA